MKSLAEAQLSKTESGREILELVQDLNEKYLKGEEIEIAIELKEPTKAYKNKELLAMAVIRTKGDDPVSECLTYGYLSYTMIYNNLRILEQGGRLQQKCIEFKKSLKRRANP